MKTAENEKQNLVNTSLTQEHLERISLAMIGSNDGIWDWDLLSNHVYYSPQWKKMLGYEEDELENHFDTWKRLVHSDDRERVLVHAQDCIDGKESRYEVEMRMLHKNGSEIIVLSRANIIKDTSNTKVIRLVGTHVDITTRRKSENFVKETNEILKMIAKGVKSSIVYDAIALMFEKRHPGMRCSLLELEDGKLLHGGAPSMPKEYCEAVHGLEFGPEIGSCGTSTFTGERVIVENIETDPKWKDIKQYALPHGMRSCWSEPIIDSQGKVLGAFGMYYDYPATPNQEESDDLLSAARLTSIVMERDHAQKRITQNEKLIAEQSKLASMGEMIGNIAHQWRQPLSVITTIASGLQLEEKYGTKNHQTSQLHLNEIIKQSQYLSQTIDDFRFFIKENSENENLSAIDLVESALTLYDATLKNYQIDVVKNFTSKKEIFGIKNELTQALLNILSNAKDAFVEKNIPEDKRFIFIDVKELAESIVIEIKDSAEGIDKHIINRIFEPYFTTKHKFVGTGIGLTMVHQIITKRHEGKIDVKNQEYTYNNSVLKGASFNLSFKTVKEN